MRAEAITVLPVAFYRPAFISVRRKPYCVLRIKIRTEKQARTLIVSLCCYVAEFGSGDCGEVTWRQKNLSADTAAADNYPIKTERR